MEGKVILKPFYPIVVVDDEREFRLSLLGTLKADGFTHVLDLNSGNELLSILSRHALAIILLDLNLPGRSGLDLIPEITRKYPENPIIVVTGIHEVDIAVECLKHGAYDYLTKPLDGDRLLNCVRRAVEICELRSENIRMRERMFDRKLENPDAFSHIVTTNDQMFTIFRYCEAVAPSSEPVLITGETGTGKELIARSLHELSGRKGVFTAVNIAGLESNMLADTLFGHVKGAFTGAGKTKKGLVEVTDGGTLFLDEIGDLRSDAQIKLLRLLQEREYFPVGAVKVKKSDTRVIAATHMNLDDLVAKGKFRKDLYFRLMIHHVRIPPLRERLDDLKLLLDFFTEQAAIEFNISKPNVSPELEFLLRTYPFPGNIRELRAMIFDAAGASRDEELPMRTFRERIKRSSPADLSETIEKDDNRFPSPLPNIKSWVNILVDEALRQTDGNQRQAAKLLGISPQALSKRLIRRHSLST